MEFVNRMCEKHWRVVDETQAMQRLSQAKNFQEVVKIQTEFMEMQMNSFNEQAKILGEMYSKAAQDAMMTPFGVPR
ncbi:MAG TPA: phasin family protein [Xanthobacteraceae bacterium]|nr:phasin family protein [Xanthobacteraceae bacterium]